MLLLPYSRLILAEFLRKKRKYYTIKQDILDEINSVLKHNSYNEIKKVDLDLILYHYDFNGKNRNALIQRLGLDRYLDATKDWKIICWMILNEPEYRQKIDLILYVSDGDIQKVNQTMIKNHNLRLSDEQYQLYTDFYWDVTAVDHHSLEKIMKQLYGADYQSCLRISPYEFNRKLPSRFKKDLAFYLGVPGDYRVVGEDVEDMLRVAKGQYMEVSARKGKNSAVGLQNITQSMKILDKLKKDLKSSSPDDIFAGLEETEDIVFYDQSSIDMTKEDVELESFYDGIIDMNGSK